MKLRQTSASIRSLQVFRDLTCNIFTRQIFTNYFSQSCAGTLSLNLLVQMRYQKTYQDLARLRNLLFAGKNLRIDSNLSLQEIRTVVNKQVTKSSQSWNWNETGVKLEESSVVGHSLQQMTLQQMQRKARERRTATQHTARKNGTILKHNYSQVSLRKGRGSTLDFTPQTTQPMSPDGPRDTPM